MFCSTVIATIGRPTIGRSVCSVLDQSFAADNFEVVVVNDSGQPLPEEDWQRSDKVLIVDTHHRERCVARNTGAAIARGRYLHFLDDDDWLLPGALDVFWKLTHNNDAIWLYGGSQLVDREGQPLIHLCPNFNGNCFIQMIAGEWIPLQASLIETKAFFSVGGFNPLISAAEDIDLGRRIALYGNVAGSPELTACIGMGEADSSTDHARLPEYSRRAREEVLNQPDAFIRMRTSANNSYWQGRIVRAYLTSMIWNLRFGRIFTAASRSVFGILGAVLAGRYIFSTRFWHAVVTQYKSETFSQGFQKAGHS